MAIEPEAGTPVEQPEGGTAEAAGTPAAEPEGGTEGGLTPEQIAEIQSENERLKQAQEQWLGEKGDYERLRRERDQRPPTTDPATSAQIDRETQELFALQRAAEQGDVAARAALRLQEQIVEQAHLSAIADPAEREETRRFFYQYRDRFADPTAAHYARLGAKALFDAKNKKPAEAPKPAAPARPAPSVATGARDAAPASAPAGPPAMPLSEYKRRVQNEPHLRDQKDTGKLVLDYSR